MADEATDDRTRFPAAAGHVLSVGVLPDDPRQAVSAALTQVLTDGSEAECALLYCSKDDAGGLQRFACFDDASGRSSYLTVGVDPDDDPFVSLNISTSDAPEYLRIPFVDLLRFGREEVFSQKGAVGVWPVLDDPTQDYVINYPARFDGPGDTKLVAFNNGNIEGKHSTGAILSLDVETDKLPPPGLMLNAMSFGGEHIGSVANYHDGSGKAGPINFTLNDDGSISVCVDVSEDRSWEMKEVAIDDLVQLARERGRPHKQTTGIMRGGMGLLSNHRLY